MPIYGMPEETYQRKHIELRFSGEEIVDPAKFDNHPEKRKDTMAFCFKLVDRCDKLVFTKWRGVITSGVGKEVNYALEKGIQVFELINETFSRVTEPVEHQSHKETRRAYFGDRFFSSGQV